MGLGDVDAVELEDVVRRFEDIYGGEGVVACLGPAFERYIWCVCVRFYFPVSMVGIQGKYIEASQGPAKEAACRAGCTTDTNPPLLVRLINAYCPRLHASAPCATARGQFNPTQTRRPSLPMMDLFLAWNHP